MAVQKGGEHRPGQALESSDVQDLIAASERELLQAPGGQFGVSIVGSSIHLDIPPGTIDPTYLRLAFFGQIVNQGKDDEPDYTDSRYWVRQLAEIDTDETPPKKLAFQLMQTSIDSSGDPESISGESVIPPALWLTATNLAEMRPGSPDEESHTLAFGSDNVVYVHMLQARTGRQLYWFDKAVGGGTRFGVVRDIGTGNERTVKVQAVVEDETATPQFVGDVVDVATWPGLFSRHYMTLVWPMRPSGQPDPVTPETNIVPVTQVNGVWRVEQFLRESMPTTPNQPWPISDCTPVQPALG